MGLLNDNSYMPLLTVNNAEFDDQNEMCEKLSLDDLWKKCWWNILPYFAKELCHLCLRANGRWPCYIVPEHYFDVTMGLVASQITSLMIVYSSVYSDADQRKHQSSASLAFVWGIHRGPVNSPHKWPVTRKMFPFDDVIVKEVEGVMFVAKTPLCIDGVDTCNFPTNITPQNETRTHAHKHTECIFSICIISRSQWHQ